MCSYLLRDKLLRAYEALDLLVLLIFVQVGHPPPRPESSKLRISATVGAASHKEQDAVSKEQGARSKAQAARSKPQAASSKSYRPPTGVGVDAEAVGSGGGRGRGTFVTSMLTSAALPLIIPSSNSSSSTIPSYDS